MLKDVAFPDSAPRPYLVGPLYHQIHGFLRDRILSGEWAGAQCLPNEADLAREYNVSIGTIRKAMDLLGQSQLVVRKQGLGTFVNSLSADPVKRFTRWVEAGVQQNETKIRTLKSGIETPSDEISARLKLKNQSQIYRFEVLNSVGTSSASINDYAIPTRFLDDITHSVSSEELDAEVILRRVMSRAVHCVDLISIATVQGEYAVLLNVGVECPILKIERTGFDADHSHLFFCTRFTSLNGAHYSAIVH
jgi:GntR family transcriptional regulator